MAKFDLENFPTRESAKRMMTRISPIYNNSYVAKWIFEIMGIEIDSVRSKYDELRLQAFPETATWGLAYWEQKYGIPVNELLDIETRRKNIISRMGYRAPMNPCKVEKIVESICGRETTVIENVKPYTFEIIIKKADTELDFLLINEHIKKIKPSHLGFTFALLYKFAVVISSRIKQHEYDYEICGTKPYTTLLSDKNSSKSIVTNKKVVYNKDYNYCGTAYTGML